MAQQVNSKYVSFFTDEYWHEINDKHYDRDKFDVDYKKNPNRMTPGQIAMNGGYDSLRSSLWSKFVDAKYNSLYNALVAVSTQVIEQITEVINAKFPTLPYKVYDGEVKKYGDNKLKYTYLLLGDYNKEYIKVTPTIQDIDNNFFSVKVETEYIDVSYMCSDVELLEVVENFATYLSTKEQTRLFVNKVYNLCGNQYVVNFNKHQIDLYDVDMMLLYHTLAKDINKAYNLNYVYSQKVIDKLWKHEIFGNIHYSGKFYISPYWYDHNLAILKHTYFFQDDKTKLPNFECCATYGDMSKDDLIELLETLQPYATSNYFAEMSYQRMKKKYDDYDKMRIGYDKRPNYFEDLKYIL